MSSVLNDMLYLTICGINGAKPDKERVEKIDMQQLFSACQSHSLTALVCYALESADVKNNAFIEAKNKSIRKNMMLDAERKKIFCYMEKNGVKHMALKGAILKDFYPKIGMRQMSDNDILFDGKYREKMHGYMLHNGYKTEMFDIEHHDEYLKPPLYNFELHAVLCPKKVNEVWYNYYANVWDRLIKDETKEYNYFFKNEDYYIFMLLHEYRHFSQSGAGLRSLLDSYVYLGKYEDSLDFDYIKKECAKLEIDDFEEKTRILSKKVFNKGETEPLTDDEKAMLNYYLGSGTYGNLKNLINNRISEIQAKDKPVTRTTKMKYIFRRLFPDVKAMKKYYPVLKKHIWLLPFVHIYRFTVRLAKRFKKVTKEIKALLK